ncbi:MAG TPA: nitroreductase family protein [Ignavibacteriaceae bacterium]|nr:nitroreductase family protein [Ignavibacteriaceae bacterium]
MIHELLEKRYSPKAFDDKNIEQEDLIKLLEAARWSPSSMNEQPWRFIVGVKNEDETHDKIYDTLADGNKLWAKNAPVLILTIASNFYQRNGEPNKHAGYDLGQAIANLTFQASAQELYVHQMGGFSAQKAKELFDIPEGFTPMSVVAIGHLGNSEDLPEKVRPVDKSKRKRKELEEIVFQDYFGNKSDLVQSESTLKS